MEKFRAKKFCLLLYPNEDETHRQVLEYLKLNYDIAYINHNLDTNELGEIKKEHTHVVISLDNAKWNTALSSEIGLSLNYIQKCRSLENALEYLIHYHDDSKYQYNLDEVKGNLKAKLEKILKTDGKDENEKSIELIEYIEGNKNIIQVSEFARYCANSGMWDVFRRASTIYLSIINEHNNKIIERAKICS